MRHLRLVSLFATLLCIVVSVDCASTLSGTGMTGTQAQVPALSAFYCSSAAMTGAGTDTCTVKLNSASRSSGRSVSLSSNSAAVKLPATVMVPANATSLQFTANVSSVKTEQAVRLTASAGSASQIFTLQLNATIQKPTIPTLSINTTSLAFENVAVNTSAMQSVTFNATGTAPLTIDTAAVTGTGFTVSGTTFPLMLNPGQTATLSVQFHPATAGAAAGQLTITSNSSTGSAAVISLSGTGIASKPFTYTGSAVTTAFVPPNPSAAISSDLFGMTILYATNPHDATSLTGTTPFPSFPIHTLRLWGVAYWLTLEPSSGVFNWTAMDGTINLGKQNNVKDFIYTFGLVPQWAATSPLDPCTKGWIPAGSCSPPADMNAFDDFATHVVQRYCGVVTYYEPWNEPNNLQFWDGTNAQLLTIAQHVYHIAKDPANCGCTDGVCAPGGGTNPNRVLLPPITGIYGEPWNDLKWLGAYLASAGTTYPYADIVAFHGYVPWWNSEGIKYQSPEALASNMPAFKQLLAQHGLGNLPLWNTEGSFEYDSEITTQSQVSFVIRYHLVQSALGVSRSIWYAYDLCVWGTLWSSPSCPANASPGPVGELTSAGQAYSMVESWLTGANLTHCTQYENGLWACELQRPEGYDAWVLWSSTGANISVPVPKASV